MVQVLDNEKFSSIQERREKGRILREQKPRSSHGIWKPMPSRPDPIILLQEHDKNRLKNLLPIKYGRMLVSPFAFMRGAAAVMAADLATTPASGLQTQLCGDAHLSNFGIFATPERKLVFDINDFDETYPGPWEWDLKRLATSAVLAGKEKGFNNEINQELAMIVTRSYQKAIENFVLVPALDVWYYELEISEVVKALSKSSQKDKKNAKKVLKEALYSTELHTMEKLTEIAHGKRQIKNNPPLMVRLRETVPEEREGWITELDAKKLFEEYIDSLTEEKRHLVSHFRISSGALRVVGIGSVGTRCFILLLEGATQDDALILQLKEADASVLEPYVAKKDYSSHAQRVVIGQKLMQAASDIFLAGIKDQITGIDYYWRQFKDMKGSFDSDSLDKTGLETYLKFCSLCLARAHARTGDAACISGYIGKSDVFCKAVTNFAIAYAEQTERDHQALKEAVKSGRIKAKNDWKTD
jgi:uncharacterized protein (DUF2252 family)